MEDRAGAKGDRPVRWWGRTAVRLPILLAVLAVVAYYGVPRILHTASAKVGPSCPTAPLAAKLPLASFRAVLTRSQIELLVGDGRLDVQGWQEPTAAWIDNPPPPVDAPSKSVVDAGYELLWWSPAQDHQGVGLFVFGNPAAAARYVREAASTRCRDAATAYQLTQPVGARAVVWTNPVHARQADVLFARGRIVYRVIEVPPDSYEQGLAILTAHELLGLSQQLACQVNQARCSPPRQSLTLTWGGWFALRSFILAATGLGRSPSPDSLARFSHECLWSVGYTDAQAREIQTGCLAIVRLLNESAAAARCARTRALACESANVSAMAADLERTNAAERQVASELSAGPCRAMMAGGASLGHRQAEALRLFAQGLLGRKASLTRLARRQLRSLQAPLTRQTLEFHAHPDACAPSPTEARLGASA